MFLLESDPTADAIKLVGIVITVVVAPLIGAFIWVLKTGMTKQTKATEENTAVLRQLLQKIAVSEVQTHAKLDKIQEGGEERDDKLDRLVQQHSTKAGLCQLSEVQADMLERSAKKTLGAQGS